MVSPWSLPVSYTHLGNAAFKLIEEIRRQFKEIPGPVSYTHLIAHNGRLVNGALLRDELAGQGAIFQTDTDSELLGHLVARQNNPCLEAVSYTHLDVYKRQALM